MSAPVKTDEEQTSDLSSTDVCVSKGDVDEEEFRCQSFQIDQSFFTKESSSEDEFIVEENCVDDYAHQLSREEKLSQEEILRIIKARKAVIPNKSEECVSARLDTPSTSYSSMALMSKKSVTPTIRSPPVMQPNKLLGSNLEVDFPVIAENSHSVISHKEDILTSQSSPVTQLGGVPETNLETSCPVIIKDSQTTFASLSSDVETDFPDIINDSQEQSTLSRGKISMNQSVPESSSQQKHFSEENETESVELFSESDSDDFIEVTTNSDETQIERMEITIDTSRSVVQDDIFADIFQTNYVSNEVGSVQGTNLQPIKEKDEQKIGLNTASENDIHGKKIPEIFQKAVSSFTKFL